MAVFGDDATRCGSSLLSPEYGSLESSERPNKAPDVVASCEREQNRTASRSSAHALPHVPERRTASTVIFSTAPNGATSTSPCAWGMFSGGQRTNDSNLRRH